MSLTHGSEYFTNLFLVVAEDSGVEVIDYNQEQLWFQILISNPFVAVRKIQ